MWHRTPAVTSQAGHGDTGAGRCALLPIQQETSTCTAGHGDPEVGEQTQQEAAHVWGLLPSTPRARSGRHPGKHPKGRDGHSGAWCHVRNALPTCCSHLWAVTGPAPLPDAAAAALLHTCSPTWEFFSLSSSRVFLLNSLTVGEWPHQLQERGV